jgi:hypothetical protein
MDWITPVPNVTLLCLRKVGKGGMEFYRDIRKFNCRKVTERIEYSIHLPKWMHSRLPLWEAWYDEARKVVFLHSLCIHDD